MAAMKKTKRLEIDHRLDTTAYLCLATGLLGHDGLQELCLEYPVDLEVDGAKVLAEGMVCTTCLRRLELSGGNSPTENVCAVLLEALKRNRSLEALELCFEENDGTSLAKFLRTLQNHPNLRSLALGSRTSMSEQTMSEQGMEDYGYAVKTADWKTLRFIELHSSVGVSAGKLLRTEL